MMRTIQVRPRRPRPSRGVGALLGLALLLFVSSSSAASVPVTAAGEGSGDTVLRFSGPLTTAALMAELTLTGRWGDVQSQPFKVTGTLDAVGESALSTLEGTLWGTLSAAGTTADGRALELRGGLFVASQDATIDLAGTSIFSGQVFLSVRLGGVAFEAAGSFEGSAMGMYVVPDDPSTMQLKGTASLSIAAEATEVPAAVEGTPSAAKAPWDLSTWPKDVASRLLALLTWKATP